GLLHDIGKALTHEQEGSHPELSLQVLTKYNESPKVINAALCGHENVKPETIEAVLVEAADGVSAARPGARRDVLESYIKRLAKLPPKLRQQHAIDCCVVNVEDAAGGVGVTPPIARQILAAGADVMTSGNHIWDKKEVVEYIVKENLLLRPANFPAGTPGVGHVTIKCGPHKVAVVNLMGRVFMLPIDCPFRKADALIPELRKETPIILVDMHAEATSESVAMGWYLDGRVSAVVGTHRHVQTADERVLPGGT